MKKMNRYKPLHELTVIRREKGLTRPQLAEMCGLSEVTLTTLELGINNPKEAKLSTLLAICKALHIKLKQLFPNEKCL